jgi:AraC-like DNA-binding protein
MGMLLSPHQVDDCGCQYIGDGKTTEGYLWFYAHEDYFAVTKCDFVFLKDHLLQMPFASSYLVLRLDYASHLPPGKVIAFMEETGNAVSASMKKGTHIANTEIMYLSVFYQKHMASSFPSLKESPMEILRNMTGEHNWPSDMYSILFEVKNHDSSNASAGLYYVGKAYELMASLLAMGAQRAPRNESDYIRLIGVIHYIENHISENIGQKDFLKIASMSPTKLKTLFRQFTGSSITDYIAAKKVDRAAHLLSDTDMSIEEIAFQTGFETPSGFATFFKKHTEITPTAYRKQMEFSCLKNPSEKETVSH